MNCIKDQCEFFIRYSFHDCGGCMLKYTCRNIDLKKDFACIIEKELDLVQEKLTDLNKAYKVIKSAQ